ncbi:MAG: NYN domain-containing protein [Planctomycetota bacterium]
MSEANGVQRIAVFLDFDNVVLGLPGKSPFNTQAVLDRVLELGKIVIKRAYADWTRYASHKPELHQLGFDLIDIPHRSMTGKNSADIRMVVDAMDVILSKPHVDTFALVTGDSDFVPLVSKLREHDKWVMGLGVKAATSKLLLHSCDEYVFYEELEGLSAPKPTPARSRSGRQPKASDRKSEAFDLLKRTVRGLNRRHDTVWSSMIKQTIMRKIPSFSESSYGYATFGEMLQAAVDAKVLEAERDRKTGNWRVIGVQE